MNDWQKILDLVVYEKMESDKWTENPLIKRAAEYLYSILLCLKKDFKTGKMPIQEEIKKIVTPITDDIVKGIYGRCKILGLSDITYRVVVIQKTKYLFQNKAIKDYINSPSFYKRHQIKKYDLKMLHGIVCKDIFQNMGNSYKGRTSIWVGMEVDAEDDAGGVWSDSTIQVESRSIIKLAIISTDILAYDGYVFNMLRDDSSAIRESIKEIYRPFLVEYYIDQKEFGEKQSTFLQQMYHEKGWYQATLADEVTDIDAEKFVTFEGIFVHSASPVEYESKKLVIQDRRVDCDALDAINSTYNMNEVDCASDTEIQKELEKLFEGVSFQVARVYKVGNGNCIYNYGKKGNKEKRFFYDIGFDMQVHIGADPKIMEKKYKGALQNIRGSIAHCIILSHWDEDHFRGCVYAKKSCFDIKWIAPNIKNSEKKGNAKRLLLYLYRIGSLMVVERETAREIIIQNSIKSRMTLYVGKGKRGTDSKITNCNCQGIAIRMENDTVPYGKIRCLMQGDVPYMSLPLQANFVRENPYEYLVAPHHGAEMDCSLLRKAVKKDGQTVICCTGNVKENRPEKNHLCELKNCYDDVKFTAQAQRYIQLELRKKNHMKIF